MRIFLSVLLLFSQFIQAQEFTNSSILGTWEVNKCELFNNGALLKTAYLDNSGIDNKIIEGKYEGKLDEDINTIIKTIIGSVITLNDDSTVSWDGTINDLNFNHEYWQLSTTGELLICKYENRFKLRPLLFVGRIIANNNEGLRVVYFESGFEARLLLIRK